MVLLELRKQMFRQQIVLDGAKFFEEPSFDRSIIGATKDGKKVIYDYDRMVAELARDNDIPQSSALRVVNMLLETLDNNSPLVYKK